MSRPIYPGVEIDLGGRLLVVPPLSLGQVQIYQDRLQELTADNVLVSAALFRDVIHAAVSRNYPDITVEQIGEWLDVGNMMDVFGAVMDVSGLRRRESEEKKARAAAVLTGTG